MKKLIILFIYLSTSLCIHPLHAQNKAEPCQYRCHYLYQYASLVQDLTRPEGLRFKRMVLDIGKQSSFFYFRAGYLAQLYADSLKSCGMHWQEAADKALLKYGYKGEFQANRVYKNYPQKGTQRQITGMLKTFYYDELMEKPQWNIQTEKKQVEGYNCQQATCTFRGRKWTAWYTSELPFSDGPWKLWGLPGLILEAYDADNYFHFTFRGMEPIDEKEESILLKKPQWIKTTRNYIKELQVLEKKDFNEFFKKVTGVYVYDEDGKKARNPVYTPIYIEE